MPWAWMIPVISVGTKMVDTPLPAAASPRARPRRSRNQWPTARERGTMPP